MFYGLSRFIKNLLPKRLFYRALLIVAAPIIILQITISIVFFDSLWIKTNKGMTRALVGEIATFISAYEYENGEYNKDSLINLFKKNLHFHVKFEPKKLLPKDDTQRWFSPIDRTLRRELKSKQFNYWFDTTSYKSLIDLRIQYLNGYFQFYIPKERVTTSSARMFALWITLPAFLLIAISLIFLKNQTRPITNLAKASAKFGRGEELDEFRPSGDVVEEPASELAAGVGSVLGTDSSLTEEPLSPGGAGDGMGAGAVGVEAGEPEVQVQPEVSHVIDRKSEIGEVEDDYIVDYEGRKVVVKNDLRSNFSALLRGLPAVTVRPVPWESGLSRPARAAGFESVVWAALFAFAGIGVWARRREIVPVLYPILLVVGLTVSMSVSQGNLGTAVRHRGQILFALAVMAVVGIQHVVDRSRESAGGRWVVKEEA